MADSVRRAQADTRGLVDLRARPAAARWLGRFVPRGTRRELSQPRGNRPRRCGRGALRPRSVKLSSTAPLRSRLRCAVFNRSLTVAAPMRGFQPLPYGRGSDAWFSTAPLRSRLRCVVFNRSLTVAAPMRKRSRDRKGAVGTVITERAANAPARERRSPGPRVRRRRVGWRGVAPPPGKPVPARKQPRWGTG